MTQPPRLKAARTRQRHMAGGWTTFVPICTLPLGLYHSLGSSSRTAPLEAGPGRSPSRNTRAPMPKNRVRRYEQGGRRYTAWSRPSPRLGEGPWTPSLSTPPHQTQRRLADDSCRPKPAAGAPTTPHRRPGIYPGQGTGGGWDAGITSGLLRLRVTRREHRTRSGGYSPRFARAVDCSPHLADVNVVY